MQLDVSSRAPAQMPLQVQGNNQTHRTQLGLHLILCCLNCIDEFKTRDTVEQHLSMGGSVVN